jgi:spoIIIJ-associated protein
VTAAREFEGKDLDEAISAASSALAIPASELAWEMVEEGRRGVFGLGARLVRIRVTELPETGRRPAPPAAVATPSKRPAPAPPVARTTTPSPRRGPDGLVETVDRMFALMGFRATAEAIAHDGGWTIQVGGPDRSQLVKRDGEILDAVEFLLNRMSRRAWPEAGSIRVACAGFHDRRDNEIAQLARKAAATVARSGAPETLPEMNPYERRLVHLTVREFKGVVSRSEGEGFIKRVRVERASD